jgi:hypothetical protein
MSELSPAAWAVYSAASVARDHARSPIAAALRAAAEQIENRYCDTDESSLDDSPGIVFAMRQLVLIATELENAQ